MSKSYNQQRLVLPPSEHDYTSKEPPKMVLPQNHPTQKSAQKQKKAEPKTALTPPTSKNIQSKPVQPVYQGPKYFLSDDTITVDDSKLHRIVAVRDIPSIGVHEGDEGGYIENEKNLSHSGSCWVFGDAMVYRDARVTDDATIRDNARVYDNAEVRGHAALYDKAQVYDRAIIDGSAKVYGNARVYDSAKVYSEACVCGYTTCGGTAKVHGHARLSGETHVLLDADIRGATVAVSNTYTGGSVGRDVADEPTEPRR